MECREAKNADNLLSVDTFSFMRNDCSAEKWVVVELSQRIKLTAVDISMLELYSSRIKTFDMYASLKKPAKTESMPWKADLWTHVATMKLQNKKGQQVSPSFSLKTDDVDVFCTHACMHAVLEEITCVNVIRTKVEGQVQPHETAQDDNEHDRVRMHT